MEEGVLKKERGTIKKPHGEMQKSNEGEGSARVSQTKNRGDETQLLCSKKPMNQGGRKGATKTMICDEKNRSAVELESKSYESGGMQRFSVEFTPSESRDQHGEEHGAPYQAWSSVWIRGARARAGDIKNARAFPHSSRSRRRR